MVSAISLSLRNAALLREARATISRIDEASRLRRCTKLAAYKAPNAVGQIFSNL
jgi:hypothetical protein